MKKYFLLILAIPTLFASDLRFELPPSIYSSVEPMLSRAASFERNLAQLGTTDLILRARLIEQDVQKIHIMQLNPKIDPRIRDVILDHVLKELGRVLSNINLFYARCPIGNTNEAKYAKY